MKTLLSILLLALLFFACSKEKGGYYVSAPKMIAITSQPWPESEPLLRTKPGYNYNKADANLAGVLKATVALNAVDDSNRTVNGKILLNITPDDRISYAAFDTEPLDKNTAFAVFLNYHRLTLQNVSNISFSIGGFLENGNGGNTNVGAILAKVTGGQEAQQLDVTYTTAQGRFAMILFRQPDGRYIFSYRGNR